MKSAIIKTTPAFDRKAKKLLTQESLDGLLDFLEENPDKGDLIRGTGGVRKLRWKSGKNDRGKSGGVRVLYHYSKGILILLITLYSKSEREDVSQAERNELKHIMPQLIAKYREDT
jgi:mRNA-degrading endonuclease RelE of RelBE toxin-antitoxin system